MNHDTHPWTMTIPVLSTAHITPVTNDMLTAGGNPWILSAEYADGYFIYVPDEDDQAENYPDLAAIFAWARKKEYTWVRLDNCGSDLDELPKYEW
jgi:hypothetical protein